jgi:hypothetical protein
MEIAQIRTPTLLQRQILPHRSSITHHKPVSNRKEPLQAPSNLGQIIHKTDDRVARDRNAT